MVKIISIYQKCIVVTCMITLFTFGSALGVYTQNRQNISCEKIAGTNPRNLIFILADDHRYDFMGLTGKVPDPYMDRLANEGAVFDNAFVTTSLCSPSRGG